MVFQLDSNVYSKQKSLSDYIAVNDARALQKAQAEQAMAASQQGIKASQMSIDAAKQKQEMDTLGRGLAGATEADYPQRRDALIKQGVPPEFLPEQYTPSYVDAILTRTGYKAKPSLAEQLMQPLSMMMGVQQPTAPQSTQSAAPIQTGSINTSPVGDIDAYATDSGVTPPHPNASLDDIVSQARAMEAGQIPTPAPNQQMMPPTLPAYIPDTNLRTPVPTYQPKTVGGAFEADKAAAKANAENQALATKPITPAERAKLDADTAKVDAKRKSDFAKLELGVKQLEQDSAVVEGAIDRAIELLESGKAGGFKSALGSWIPNSDTGELAGVIETIKGSNIINTLQTIRASNPTGGAFGNQTEKESAFVAASKGVLDPNQSDLTLRNLKLMKANLPSTLQDRRTALAKTFPDLYQPPQTAVSAPSAKTVKWDDLP